MGWFRGICIVVLFVLVNLDLIVTTPHCPLDSPCSCTWDKNSEIPDQDKRNQLTCYDTGITEKNLPLINDPGNNLTFFKVNLSKNHFDDIPVKFVDSLIGVEFLDFTANTISGLPDKLIDQPNLRRLYLSNNKIVTINTGKFVNLESLWTLLLDNNRLVSLEAGAFDGLRILNHLTLSSNQLDTITPNTFQDLGQLDYLSLHNNHLTELSPGTFNGLGSLHTLRLDKNKLKSLSDNILSPLASLNRLDIDVNKLESVNVEAFKGLTELLTLYLGSNMLSSLPDGFFADMTKLQHLSLEKNSLSSITPATFTTGTKFKSLTWLNFSKNKGLKTFHRDFFKLFPNLEVLELTGLHLVHLPYLGTLSKLDVLLIDDTFISTLYPCDFVGISSLTELYWDGAPIDCGCQSFWMKTWTDEYMKVRPKDARLNPKGTLPDWKWRCKKPIMLVNKDFRQILPEQVSGQCKKNENQQWCHSDKIIVGNLTFDIQFGKGVVSLNWDISDTIGSEFVKGYQVTIGQKGANSVKDAQRVRFNETRFTFDNLENGVSYVVCVEALGWGESSITRVCKNVHLSSDKDTSTLAIGVSVTLIIVLVLVVITIFIFLKKRGLFNRSESTTVPNVSFSNKLSGEEQNKKAQDEEPSRIDFTNSSLNSDV